ncbi:MAG: transporter [candidate division KSB1 bacterium]|nr:transporter [candidate division KSB1 bacterium]MDZ7349443.1 transporter [candidate division KSB1 bacterium]MDZ7353381.1 transporter [candidate division KSB1 bacterium]MDZ7396447.1 transporter [candidate division KSB1 bacterium]MDZ7409162.1 transporter [candidate division KSB1 bacterium]
MKYRTAAFFLLMTWGVGVSQTKNETDDIRLFQTFFQDAPIATAPYGEGLFQYSTYDNDLSSIDLAVQAALPVAEKLQLGGGLGFRNISPDVGDSQSGISDLLVSGRYNVVPGPTVISVGALLTLPIGSEDIGEGTLDFGGFGSLRHRLESGLVLTGTLGLDFAETKVPKFNPSTGRNETDSEYDNSLLLGGGVIYPTKNKLNLIGELNFRTEGDYILLSGGIDYPLKSGGRLRGGLGLGLDDGAPNFTLRAGYLLGF